MTSWRDAAATAIDAQARVLETALEAIDEAHEVLERLGRDGACQELRGTAAAIRAEISDLRSQARALRTSSAGAGDGFPLALTAGSTTRHPRGAPP